MHIKILIILQDNPSEICLNLIPINPIIIELINGIVIFFSILNAGIPIINCINTICTNIPSNRAIALKLTNVQKSYLDAIAHTSIIKIRFNVCATKDNLGFPLALYTSLE